MSKEKKEREVIVNDFKAGVSIEQIADSKKCEKEIIEEVIRTEMKGKNK
jgi:hypothetical protein